MAIKTLQNNFTTPEQSKRLLELGVPADSADCYYAPFTRGVQVRHEPYELRSTFFDEYPFSPCWSVGRLMEIWEICVGVKFDRRTRLGVPLPLIEDCIEHIEFALNPYSEVEFDFSKLED